jgi:hypothetical protein
MDDGGTDAPASAGNQRPLVLKPAIHKVRRSPSRLRHIIVGFQRREGEAALNIHASTARTILPVAAVPLRTSHAPDRHR